jgi:hypothetical protein
MPQVATPTNTAGTAVGRDASGNTAVGQLTNTNVVFTEAPAVDTGRVYQVFTKLTGQPANHNLVGKYSDNAGEANDNFVLALGYNVGSNHLQESASEHSLYYAIESRFKQGSDWLCESQLRYFNAAGTQKRLFGFYTNLSSDVTELQIQSDYVEFRQTDARYDLSSAWMRFDPQIVTFQYITTGSGAAYRQQGKIQTSWTTADNATREGRMSFYVTDFGSAQEVLRLDATGTATPEVTVIGTLVQYDNAGTVVSSIYLYDQAFGFCGRSGVTNLLTYHSTGGASASGLGHSFRTGSATRASQTERLLIANDFVKASVPFQAPSSVVASLPTGAAGAVAFASNGRKNGEGAGAGTGVLVFHDGTAWRACDTGATVAA